MDPIGIPCALLYINEVRIKLNHFQKWCETDQTCNATSSMKLWWKISKRARSLSRLGDKHGYIEGIYCLQLFTLYDRLFQVRMIIS